mmetsp:Transcript_33478/g.82239  ORF Transcript_33478/g.82239 Transcript_33478/m.82239 type:complete len:223 (+) Transcript_33478:600-1268(+)
MCNKNKKGLLKSLQTRACRRGSSRCRGRRGRRFLARKRASQCPITKLAFFVPTVSLHCRGRRMGMWSQLHLRTRQGTETGRERGERLTGWTPMMMTLGKARSRRQRKARVPRPCARSQLGRPALAPAHRNRIRVRKESGTRAKKEPPPRTLRLCTRSTRRTSSISSLQCCALRLSSSCCRPDVSILPSILASDSLPQWMWARHSPRVRFEPHPQVNHIHKGL